MQEIYFKGIEDKIPYNLIHFKVLICFFHFCPYALFVYIILT